MQRYGGEGEGEKALQFKSELLRGVFGEWGEKRRGGRGELVVGLFRRGQMLSLPSVFFNNKV